MNHQQLTQEEEGGGWAERDRENHNCCLIFDGWVNGFPCMLLNALEYTVSDSERLEPPDSSFWTNYTLLIMHDTGLSLKPLLARLLLRCFVYI